MNIQIIKKYMDQWLENKRYEFYDIADKIWANPELGLEEYFAADLLTSVLKKNGFTVEMGQGGMDTAFIATYGTTGPIIGINCEYDCLPGLSQRADCAYPNPVQDGAPGHGCGHNLLGTAAVFSAVAISCALQAFHIPCVIKVLGSPYEEASVGKALIAKEGYYADLDAVIDWHPWDDNRADYDSCNSVFVMRYQFKGASAHGASPWEGRSALDAGMLFGMAIEMLREHIKPNNANAANTINYTFQNCGPLYANIIPDETTVQLYGRFADMETSEDALQRINDCARGAALATQTAVCSEIVTYTHNKIPNRTLAEIIHNNLELYGPPQFSEKEQVFAREMQKYAGIPQSGLDTTVVPLGYSETIISDTSEFSWNAPYATFWLALGPKGGGWHNWMVTACAGGSIGKKVLSRAAQIMSASVIDLICQPEALSRAKKEWAERMGGRVYKSLLPENHVAPLGINRSIMERFYGNTRARLSRLQDDLST